MNVQTWKIIPYGLSGLHIGKQGMAQERSSIIYHSDSLFSALFQTLAAVSDKIHFDELLNEFNSGDPPFSITSAYPFAGDIRFFPMPLNVRFAENPQDKTNALKEKELKRISFVSEKIFRKLLGNYSKLSENLIPTQLLKGGLLVSEAELQNLPVDIRKNGRRIFEDQEKHARVTIGRINNASNLFFTGNVRFAPDCGLWFGIKWLKQTSPWKETLPFLFSLLEDEGIGGERSSGIGQVKIEPWRTVELPDPSGKLWITLSRYLPLPEEFPALSDKNARYSLDFVGGWMYSPGSSSQRRKSINMLKEGSVLGALANQPIGKIENVAPSYANTQFSEHPVYRSGLAIGVGFDEESNQ